MLASRAGELVTGVVLGYTYFRFFSEVTPSFPGFVALHFLPVSGPAPLLVLFCNVTCMLQVLYTINTRYECNVFMPSAIDHVVPSCCTSISPRFNHNRLHSNVPFKTGVRRQITLTNSVIVFSCQRHTAGSRGSLFLHAEVAHAVFRSRCVIPCQGQFKENARRARNC